MARLGFEYLKRTLASIGIVGDALGMLTLLMQLALETFSVQHKHVVGETPTQNTVAKFC